MIDKNSPTWLTIKENLTVIKTRLITRLIREDCDKTRGKIQLINEILSMPEKTAPIPGAQGE